MSFKNIIKNKLGEAKGNDMLDYITGSPKVKKLRQKAATRMQKVAGSDDLWYGYAPQMGTLIVQKYGNEIELVKEDLTDLVKIAEQLEIATRRDF